LKIALEIWWIKATKEKVRMEKSKASLTQLPTTYSNGKVKIKDKYPKCKAAADSHTAILNQHKVWNRQADTQQKYKNKPFVKVSRTVKYWKAIRKISIPETALINLSLKITLKVLRMKPGWFMFLCLRTNLDWSQKEKSQNENSYTI
jgi:hypothetical protein